MKGRGRKRKEERGGKRGEHFNEYHCVQQLYVHTCTLTILMSNAELTKAMDTDKTIYHTSFHLSSSSHKAMYSV